MATTPRYTATPNPGSNAGTGMAPTLKTAAADYTGINANNKAVFTAGSGTGSRLVGLKFVATGTNTQSVARVYINNGSTNTTATNNSLIGMVTLPGTTASNTVAELSASYYFDGGALDLKANWAVYVGLATTVAAGWVVTPILGGDY